MNRIRMPYLVAAAGATYLALVVTGAGRAGAATECPVDALGRVVRFPAGCTPPAGATEPTSHPLQDTIDDLDQYLNRPRPEPSFFGTATAGLGVWYGWLAVLLILAGAGMMLAKKPENSIDVAGRRSDGPAAGINAARLAQQRGAGAAAFAAGATLYAFAAWSMSATILVAVPAGIAAALGVSVYQKAAAREKGFEAREREYQQQVAEAQHAAANAPIVYDPLHPDVIVSRPQPAFVPEPSVTGHEAQMHHVSGGVQRPAGSAAALLVTESGSPSPAHAAWETAAQATGHGTHAVDAKGRPAFAPTAVIAAVRVGPNGEPVEIVVRADDVAYGDQALAKMTGPFLAAAHVRRAVGAWQRDHVAGTWTLTVTNSREAQAPTAAQPVDDEWV